MPTFEVPPRRTVSLGAVEFLFWHVSWAPTEFLQVGGATLIFPPGASLLRLYSLGLKVRFWRSLGVRPGLAVGTNFVGIGSDFMGTGSWHQSAAYVVAGWRGTKAELHLGAFPLVASVTRRGVYEIGAGESQSESETTYHLAVGGTFRLSHTSKAMSEFWVLDARSERLPFLISGLRLFDKSWAVEVAWGEPFYGSRDERHGFPLFVFYHYFD